MTEPLCVFRVISWLPVGGIERRLLAIMPALQNRGYSMHLVCTREYGALAGELRSKGIPVKLIQFNSRFDPSALWRLRSELVRHKAQVVHSHMYRSSVPATVAAKLAGVPAIFSQVHNLDTWQSGRQIWMDRQLARFRSGVITVSRAVQEEVCEVLRLPESKVPILYNGVDVDQFKPDAALRLSTREALGVPADRPMILVPARLHPQKLPLETLASFERILPKLPCKPILAFAGAGKLEDELKAAVAERGLGDSVLQLGKRDDMVGLYNAADVVLLSSLKEGFSNAIIEALACGKPVVAADVGGNKEAVSTPEVGWIHPCRNFDLMETQLVEALTHWERLAERASACRARGEDFSLEAMVNETDRLYRSALEAKGITR
ncbi:MAG: glycosyltransferase [Candidatus Sumerlaeia bacterium]|nr:glycosyltransferase [Candidatus Sumerlaeia bacterium]